MFPFSKDKDIRTRMCTGKKFVHIRHFPVEAFSYGSKGRRSILQGYTPVFGSALVPEELEDLPGAVTQLRNGKTRERDIVCVCHQPGCEENLRTTGEYFRLPKDPARALAWLKILCPRRTKLEEEALLAAKRAYVARHHFRSEQMVTRDTRVDLTRNATPRAQPWPQDSSMLERVGSLETLREMGNVRSVVLDATGEVGHPSLVRALAESSLSRDAFIEEEEEEEEEEEDPLARFNFNIMHRIGDPNKCQYYLGEPAEEVVDAYVELLEAAGFGRMRRYRTVTGADFSQAGQKPRDARGRKTTLNLKEQFVAWLMTFRRFRRNMPHVADLFGVVTSTIEENYDTWTIAMGIFGGYMNPMPTGVQLAAMTPARITGKLRLVDGSAVVMGDCTERWLDDPGTKKPAERNALHSKYKKHTTGKILTYCTGSTYLAYASPVMCGGITDTQGHALTGLASRLPVPGVTDQTNPPVSIASEPSSESDQSGYESG
jgi:hypothetical protein